MKHLDVAHQVPDKKFKVIEEMYKKDGKNPKWSIKRNKCFLLAAFGIENDEFTPIKVGINPAGLLERLISSMIHVPGLRGNPERTYKILASDEIYPGSFEKYIASIIVEWKKLKSKKDKIEELTKQLFMLGLATNIEATRINDTRVELQVSRFNDNNQTDTVNIADVGFGVSQILPVLVALLCAKKGQLVYIEQPELHLHPNAQFRLSEIIAKASKRGVMVVVETHSSILLRGFQIQVVKKVLDHEKVSLNWFTQDNESGETQVATEQLDELGAFGEWPEDFDNVSLNVEQIYLDAVEEALNGK